MNELKKLISVVAFFKHIVFYEAETQLITNVQ